MHEPTGDSGVQAVPKILQSVGFFNPRRISARARLVVGHRLVGDAPLLLGVPRGVLLAQTQGAVRERAEAPPLEARAQLEHLFDQRDRHRVAVADDRTRVLVLDLVSALVELADEHED